MWSAQFDIIVETLTGSEFEVTVTDKDTIGFIKSQIQTHEGIPVAQQNLIFKDRELSDDLEMRDIPLVKGSRLKFVLGMKGGPVSARRVVSLPDYDNWLDLNDILNSSRQDPLTIATPRVRLMVYKNYKKNIHRAMKCRADRKKQQIAESQKDDDGLGDLDNQDDTWLKVNQHTFQKMMQIRSKLVSKKKKRNPLFRRQTSDERSGEPSETKTSDIGAVGDRPNQKQRGGDANLDGHNFQLMANFTTDDEPEMLANRATRNCCKSCNRHAKHIYTDLPENRNLLNKHGLTKTCTRQQSLPQINQNGSSTTEGAANMINCPSSGELKPIDFHDYFNVNSDIDLANNINHYTENRLKLRDNIRRNRSFKTISNHDLLVEEPLPPYYSRHLLGRPQTTSASSSSAIDRFLANRKDDRSQSASFHDLIEQFSNKNKHRTAHSNESLTECGGDASASYQTQPYFENTSPTLHAACEPIARRTSASAANFHNFGFSLSPDTHANSFADYAMGRDSVGPARDNSTFRLYNTVSEPKHQYELPKLLIREDSPVETIHSSDPQLETVTMCGGGSSKGGAEQTSNSTIEKLPNIDHHHHHLQHRHSTQGRPLHNDLFTSFTPSTDEQMIRNPWSHHHSDLGLNHIDLNCLSTNDLSSSSEHMGSIGPTNHNKLFPTNVSHTIKSWKKQGIAPHSTGSMAAKSSGELSSTAGVGNNDAFLGSGPKANHSADQKEFRMKFGSSPTLLSFPRHNTNQQTQQIPSRLDAVPFQYRRGYTNLNDVCLSSSTSDLDGYTEACCPRGSTASNSKQPQHDHPDCVEHHGHQRVDRSAESERLSAGHSDAILRNRKHHRLDYVRSYENLDSNNSLVGLMDDQGAELGGGGGGASGYSNESCYTHFERNHTSGEDDFLDPPGRYDYSTDSFSTTAASGFQSNESLFNVNFDSFEDTILDIEKLTLFEPLSPCTAIAPPSPAPHQEPSSSHSFSTTNQFNDSRLLLYETMLESIDAELRQCRHTLPSNDVVLSKLTIDVAGSEPLTVADNASFAQPPAKKNDKLRCAECNKRLGVIMVMRCHCDKVFCAQHRYAEAHNCTYDFKLNGKFELERDNPLVVATKLPKI